MPAPNGYPNYQPQQQPYDPPSNGKLDAVPQPFDYSYNPSSNGNLPPNPYEGAGQPVNQVDDLQARLDSLKKL